MKTVLVTVPAKVLLAGEYSILNHKPGLAFALSYYLQVYLTKRSDSCRRITSQLWDHSWESSFEAKEKDKSLHSIDPLISVALLAAEKTGIKGFDLKIVSELPIEAGIGSSSALRLGVVSGFFGLKKNYKEKKIDLWEEKETIAKIAFEHQKQHQKRASGYDIICQLKGGLGRFEINPLEWSTKNYQKLTYHPSLTEHVHLFFGSKGSATSPLLASQTEWLKSNKKEQDFDELNAQMLKSFEDFIADPLSEKNRMGLFSCFAHHRSFLSQSPAAIDQQLFSEIKVIKGFGVEWEIKTTGAGGQDALLFVGKKSSMNAAFEKMNALGWKLLPFNIAEDGASSFWQNDDGFECPC